jgi:hypothetical protein
MSESLDDLEEESRKADRESSDSSCGYGLFGLTYFKMLLGIFLIFVFLNSTLFTESFVAQWANGTDANGVTNKGVVVLGLFMVIGFMALDGLARLGI